MTTPDPTTVTPAAPADGPPAQPTAGQTDPPSYEHARAELREIVGKLEAGSGSLEDSLALWERGEHLAELCRTWLDGASARLNTVGDSERAKPGSQAQVAPDSDPSDD